MLNRVLLPQPSIFPCNSHCHSPICLADDVHPDPSSHRLMWFCLKRQAADGVHLTDLLFALRRVFKQPASCWRTRWIRTQQPIPTGKQFLQRTMFIRTCSHAYRLLSCICSGCLSLFFPATSGLGKTDRWRALRPSSLGAANPHPGDSMARPWAQVLRVGAPSKLAKEVQKRCYRAG